MNNKYYSFYEKKDKLISELLRSEIYLPFGLESMKYKTIFTDQVPMGAIACTDFEHIFINPDDKFYNRVNTPFSDLLTFTFLHEVAHNIFSHKQRGESKDPELWNYATDFFINLFLSNLETETAYWENQHRLVVMNIHRYSEDICFDKKFDNMIEEEIYTELQKNGSYKKNESEQSYKDFLDSVGAPSDNVSPDAKVKITKSELNYNGKKFKNTKVEFPKHEGSGDSGEDSLDSSITKTMFEGRVSGRGFQNKNFESLIKKLFEVKVPWDQILRDSLLIDLTKKGDISYGRPSKIWLCNPTMSYMASIEEQETLGTVVVCIDESGSISDDDIGKAITIINQAKSYYKNVLVLKHDTKCTWTHTYEDELTKDSIDDLCVRRHCGGTSHKDVFEKIIEFSKLDDIYISCIIVVSDMISDLEEAQKILCYNTPMIYLRSGTYEVDNIIGKVINID